MSENFEYDEERGVYTFECDRCGSTASVNSQALLARYALRGGCPGCTK